MFDDEQLKRLLERVSQRDQNAFKELYSITNGHLFGITLRVLRDRSISEDVLQEIYIKIWRHAAEFHTDRGTAIGWMRGISNHAAIDELRRSKRRPVVDTSNDLDTWANEEPDPVTLVIAGAGNKALMTCLGEIGDNERTSLVYAYVHGMTHSEVATHLSSPVGSVKSWIKRGLVKLKECLSR